MKKKIKDSLRPLLFTQFFGAFNDNAFKMIISLFGIQLLGTSSHGARFVSIVGALFILPFIIFSPYAGYFADKFRKRNIIVAMKWFEVFIMCAGLFALWSQNFIVLCVVLFIMATQSAFFAPAKYGILPEMLEEKDLSKGNGYLQMWTFVAIILGTACGARMKDIFEPFVWKSSFILIALAVLGLIGSLKIAKGSPANSDTKFSINGFAQMLEVLGKIKKQKALFLSLCAISYFWFLGSVFQMNILIYAKGILGIGDSSTGILLAMVSLGIGLGSLFAGNMSEGRIEFGFVPLGAIGLSIFCFVLGSSSLGYKACGLVLLLLGFSAGLYTIPLNAYFQKKSPDQERGKYLAALNIVNSIAMLCGSLFVWICGDLFMLDPAQTFVVLGIFSVLATLYILKTLPTAFVRLVNWLITHSIYKMNIVDVHNVPEQGGALLICNHVSWVDALIASASLHRPVRFMMYRKIFELPLIHTVCKAANVIPVAYDDGPKGIMKSLQDARQAIEDGDLVCVFPEGMLTRTGNMLPFNRGFEKIMEGLDAPIIPLYLDNIWGSIFSFSDGKYFWKKPKRLPYPMTVVFGDPMSSSSKVYQVRAAVQALGAYACNMRGRFRQKLHIAFIDGAKKSPFKFCMADSTGIKFNFLQALTAVLVLKKKLFPKDRRPMETNEMVGVLMPASCMASVANGAIMFAGKVSVNLNFTLSKESFESSIKQCSMKMIITSRKFLEKIGMQECEGMVFLEDVKDQIQTKDRIKAVLMALLVPAFLIKKFCVDGDKLNVDDTATIIFSSGSTGEPKGIMLSHGNIFSNIEGFYQVFDIKRNDVVMGALPFFHSFGFTATMCFPVGAGIGVVYHTNPMDAPVIGKLVKKYKATILMGTPTFLAAYLRRCTPEQFKTVRHAVAGAEKLKQQLSDAFYEKYKVVPFEGYGATELSPIVSVGYPGYINKKERIKQVGNKAGKVGHPIPGVAVKIVNPDTFEMLDFEQEGLLLVKGPNVMKGYLNNPQKTEEVMKDGWYITGDIAKIDNDGFVQITDRLSRFSKIGGEMVPHIKVEEKIMEALGAIEPVCAVTSVADEKKGERLVVLYTGDIDTDWLWDALNQKDLPKLWIPKKDSFYQIDQIPVLGTGKVDLKGVKTLAQDLMQIDKESSYE